VSNIHAKKGANFHERLKASLEDLLLLYSHIVDKSELSIKECQSSNQLEVNVLGISLFKYLEYLKKFSDQLERRILKGEKIPHEEKIFSIFEPEVEWLQKGKQNNKVELGHNVLVTTDQYNLILDYKVMLNQRDNSQPITLGQRLQERYNEGYHLASMSFDRGFFSKLSKEALQKIVDKLVMPSKGRVSKDTKLEQEDKEYKKLAKKHSAIESNINELEQSGLDKVPDKGLKAFERYVGYGVLAYNLKRLGLIILSTQKEKEKHKPSSRRKRAA